MKDEGRVKQDCLRCGCRDVRLSNNNWTVCLNTSTDVLNWMVNKQQTGCPGKREVNP
jgi:hypothetical protein